MVTYTAATNVASLLNMTESDGAGGQQRLVFDGVSIPTVTEVNDLIEEWESYIDEVTESTWLTKTATDEYHNFLSFFNRGRYLDDAGRPLFSIDLKFENAKTFASGSGDKIEYFDGSNWINYLTAHTLGTAMYEEDFWIDYQHSQIHLFNQFPAEGQNMFRVTYRYGVATVPKGIRKVCTLFVGADVVERFDMYKTSDKDSSPSTRMAESYRTLAEKLLREYNTLEIEVI